MNLTTLIGGYNLLALIVAENLETLESIVSKCAITSAKNIRRSEVLIARENIYPKYLPIRIVSEKTSEVPPCSYNCCKCNMYLKNKCLGCPATKCYKGPL